MKVCCHSVVATVFIGVKRWVNSFPKTLLGHQLFLSLGPDHHVTSSISHCRDCCWFEVIVSQSAAKRNQASHIFFFVVVVFCTGITFFTSHCVAFTINFKGREDMEEDNSMSHHTFVLQARAEVSFMRRWRRHWKKQLMKTKLQFPDAFELPAALIWLSPFRLPSQL